MRSLIAAILAALCLTGLAIYNHLRRRGDRPRYRARRDCERLGVRISDEIERWRQ